MQRGNSTGQQKQTESHDIKQKRQFSAYKYGVLHVLLRVQTHSVWVSWPDCVFKWKAPSVWMLAAEMITDSDDTRWFPPDWGSSCNFTVCVSVCVCGSLEMYLCFYLNMRNTGRHLSNVFPLLLWSWCHGFGYLPGTTTDQIPVFGLWKWEWLKEYTHCARWRRSDVFHTSFLDV